MRISRPAAYDASHVKVINAAAWAALGERLCGADPDHFPTLVDELEELAALKEREREIEAARAVRSAARASPRRTQN